MPTPSTSDLPKPKSWDEFEDIVWEIYTRRWQDPHAQRYGRSGQAQKGVDIYGQQSDLKKYIAVQCKRYEDNRFNLETIISEVAKVEDFPSPISEYIIATTASRDTKIQDSIRDLNQERLAKNIFPIYVVFWEDLCSYLVEPSSYDLLKKYYSAWGEVFVEQRKSVEEKKIATLNPLDILLSRKFCECTNYLGIFVSYFIEDELGHEKAESLVNNSICTNSLNYSFALEAIASIFERKSLTGQSNAISKSGDGVSWQEFLLSAFDRIRTNCESLLTKYGGSGSPELVLELERIKDVSGTMIGLTGSNNSSYTQETHSDEIRRKVYTHSFLKPYFVEVIRVRILAIQYLSSSSEARIQPKVLPGENLKIEMVVLDIVKNDRTS